MSRKPQLADVLSDAITGEIANVHTSIPGKILSYDSTTQTATIQISVQFSRRGLEGERVTYKPAPLSGVPILWRTGGGGAYSDTWPLERGDEVWVLFAERGIDEWVLEGNTATIPATTRRFDLSDAVALPVQSSRKTPLPPDAIANARVIRGDELRLGSSGANDYVALASLVRAELDALWSAMSTHVHPVPLPTPANPTPSLVAIVTPSVASVASTKVKAE